MRGACWVEEMEWSSERPGKPEFTEHKNRGRTNGETTLETWSEYWLHMYARIICESKGINHPKELNRTGLLEIMQDRGVIYPQKSNRKQTKKLKVLKQYCEKVFIGLNDYSG